MAGPIVRQIDLRPDGTAETSRTADWPMNAPFGHDDPLFTSHEISPDEFERAWKCATSVKE